MGGQYLVGASKTKRRLQGSMFVQHERTRVHKEAQKMAQDQELALGSPSSEQFCKVIGNIQTNGAKGPLEGVGGVKKLRKMIFCVAEAIRDQDRHNICK